MQELLNLETEGVSMVHLVKYKGFHEALNSCRENYKECFTLMKSNMKRALLRKQGYTTKDKEYYSDN